MKKFVIEGGPCSGKTTGFAIIEQKMADRGYHPIMVPEAATLVMAGNIKPTMFSEADFQRAVLRVCHHLEHEWESIAKLRPELNPIMFLDRAKHSGKAYTDLYPALLAELNYGSEVEVRDHYDAVFHLRTAAYGAEAFYTLKNNTNRRESTLEAARAQDDKTLDAWTGHPHLRVIDNSTDFDGKMHRLDQEICAALGIPVPLEIERKFVLRPVAYEDIAVPYQAITIEQTYLQSTEPGTVLRVRKRGQNGSFLYYRTQKRDVTVGVRQEIEERITREAYEACLAFKEQGTRAIHKQRLCFVYKDQYFELDMIPHQSGILYMLELELTEQNQKVTLPPFLSVVKEVTDNPAYSNYALSRVA